MAKFTRGLWILSTLTLLVLTGLRMAYSFHSGSQLNHVCGVLIALAQDLSQGVLYRPLYSPDLGFGGTVYFPLYFCLQGLLLKLGLGLYFSGYVLDWLSGLAVLGGVAALLRRQGHGWGSALLWSGAVLAAGSFQYGVSAIRVDLLATALSLWGLVLGSGHRPRWGWAAGFFALAFATKLTAVAGAVALTLFLLGQRNFAGARRLVLATGGLQLGVLALMQIASQGRFLPMARACFSDHQHVKDTLRAPLELWASLCAGDASSIPFLALALALAIYRLGKGRAGSLLDIFYWVNLAVTLQIFTVRGTDYNHIVDLYVASILLLAAHFQAGPKFALSLTMAAVQLWAGVYIGEKLVRVDMGASKYAGFSLLAHKLGPGPYLSEDPLVPLHAGEPVYLLDPFHLRLVAAQDPHWLEPMLAKLRAHEFRAVFFKQDPRHPATREWYAEWHMGPQVCAEVLRSYRFYKQMGGYYVFVPR